MKGILVTGATTPIGEALVRALLADEDVDHILAVGIEPDTPLGHGHGDRLKYLQLDLTRSRNVRGLLFGPARDLGVRAIVHAVSHRSARDSGVRVHQENVETTRALLALAEADPNIDRFIFRSYSDVYSIRPELPSVIDESQPINLEPHAPQWIRDRVEADLAVSTRAGLSDKRILVLRFAECLAPRTGSQLCDYLQSRVCFYPAGFDPMLNLITVEDMVQAFKKALHADAQGIFNIPGKDTLPLSTAIAKAGRIGIPAVAKLISPLYWARAKVRKTDFRYDLNHWRFHFNGVLDGARAASRLDYRPSSAVDWPRLRDALSECRYGSLSSGFQPGVAKKRRTSSLKRVQAGSSSSNR